MRSAQMRARSAYAHHIATLLLFAMLSHSPCVCGGLSRMLVFASVRELSSPRKVDGAPRPLLGQLIAGRALVAAVGEEEAAAVMRTVRAGAVFRVRGRIQRNPREVSSEEVTTADMVARSIELVAEPLPAYVNHHHAEHQLGSKPGRHHLTV